MYTYIDRYTGWYAYCVSINGEKKSYKLRDRLDYKRTIASIKEQFGQDAKVYIQYIGYILPNA